MIKVVERHGRLYMEMCFGGVESHVEVNERTANYLLHTLHEAASAIKKYEQTHKCEAYKEGGR